MTERVAPQTLLAFWRAAGPDRWFAADPEFDAELRRRFSELQAAASRRELMHWADTAEGALALVIALDQLPRNLFRGSPSAFATDPLAREAARAAIARGFDRLIALPERRFFYLPFEHSEDLADQEFGLRLVEEAGDAEGVRWAKHHRDIVQRFGRFPHRNEILGRISTPEETAFLAAGGFRG